tara:strand:+ start:45 stop:203 length:159 start_codon:yes stop_codon:yes gene_type:complete
MLSRTLYKLPKKDLIKIIINLQNYINKDSLVNNKNKDSNIKIPKDKIYYWID